MSSSKEDDCTKKPCVSRNKDNSNDDPNADIYNRPLLYAGVLWIGLVKNILIPSSCRQPSGTDLPARFNAEDPPHDVSHSHSGPGARDDVHERGDDQQKKRVVSDRPVKHLGASPISQNVDGVVSSVGQTEGHWSLADLVRDSQQQMQWLADETILLFNDSRHVTAEALERVRGERGATGRALAVAGGGLAGYLAAAGRPSAARAAFAGSGAVAAAVLCWPGRALELDAAAAEVVGDTVRGGVRAFRTPTIPNQQKTVADAEEGNKASATKPASRNKDGADGRRKNAKADRPPRTLPAPPSGGRWPYSPALPAPSPTSRGGGKDLSAKEASGGVIEKYFSDGGVEVFVRVVTDAARETGDDEEDDVEVDEEGDEEGDVEDGEQTAAERSQQDLASHYPMNKKLSRYYRKSEEEEVTPYLDRGNEDLYVKRR